MSEETNEANVDTKKKVNEGDKIQIIKGEQKGKTGEVLMIRENSVIVKIGNNKGTGEPIKTVVNHKNYKRMK
ncbi:DUF2187 family protein [Oceanobacillus polygoni]|uniref:Uncharacterized protein YkvS n=1 Tax=Oceanobacillus polygoni TaxID=1235259 RepID=A0A9X0YTX6_9BACI|nr:DUF2187 family protein [Oceanobacillus polygoni]MBP2078767.1 uncharacterized protein YkvS [Oceanobacillus polygoni]